jgi:hypothetical protein
MGIESGRFQRRTRMTRGVGRTSPYPAAVSGSTRVPSHGGGTVPGAGRREADEVLESDGLREGSAVVGDAGVDEVSGAGWPRASCSGTQPVGPVASRSPTSANRTRRPTPTTLTIHRDRQGWKAAWTVRERGD